MLRRATVRWRIASVGVIGLAALAFGVLPFGTGCHFACAQDCPETDAPILETTGYLVVAATSSCANTWHSVLPGGRVQAFALAEKTTCHFDVTLDDGEVLSFDVPFTKDGQSCCCGSCVQVELPDWSPLMLTAPPGYVPNIDAGADASDE